MAPTQPVEEKRLSDEKHQNKNRVKKKSQTCRHCGKGGHAPAKCWQRPAEEGGLSVPVGSAQFWRNKRDNLLDMATSQAIEMASLKAKHKAACEGAVEAEKKARIADTEKKGAVDVTQDTYKRLLED